MKTVVFVANFMNMLEPEERQHVQQRLRFVAESFRSEIPAGISNLYQVDALPALRARLKGDDNLLYSSGLSMFVSALQMIFESQQNEVINLRQQLLPPIASQITGLLHQKIELLTQEVETLTAKQTKEIQLKEHAKKLIQAGWNQSLQDLEKWLHLPTLINTYQVTMILALQQAGFADWEQINIMTKLQNYQVEINNWLLKLSDFFDDIPKTIPLDLTCPEPPEVELVKANNTASTLDQMTPTALVTGLGWMFGGPIGAAVIGGASILVNKVGTGDKSGVDRKSNTDLTAYVEATEDYLCRLNLETIANIQEYRSTADSSIYCPTISQQPIESPQSQKLVALQNCLMNLQTY
jgi:hypothetical protein